ncbi:hypothetical protein [Sphingomonas sp. KC8]|uniref:hypothetical protein n=1 Tax=Sphingomonas sp. KC8 TaxID=1030157 RepID=UPI0002488EC4|nr:hypothetical protein [Sphingomonas sp. KC8]ARS25774.1 hypothetical protein KC8_00500 [Sphingomonas sp. KC8]
MTYDPGALEIALAAAVGDDPMLVAELGFVFRTSAHGHADALGRASGAPEWRTAAMRLQGLAASFGAVELMVQAERAIVGSPGDPAVLADIARAIDTFIA